MQFRAKIYRLADLLKIFMAAKQAIEDVLSTPLWSVSNGRSAGLINAICLIIIIKYCNGERERRGERVEDKEEEEGQLLVVLFVRQSNWNSKAAAALSNLISGTILYFCWLTD